MSTCSFTGCRSGSVTKLHVSDDALLAEALADGVDDALTVALLEVLAVDSVTGALLDAHSAPLDGPEPVGVAEPEAPGATEPPVHAASASVRAREEARSGPREVCTAGKVAALPMRHL